MTHSATTATLFCPRVSYTSTGESQFDAMMTWRADLELSYFDEDDDAEAPDVVGGFAEFLVIDIGEHSIADMLDSLSQDTEIFAGLFEGDDVVPAVREQFDDAPFNRVLIVTLVEIAGPLRGHGLGAWLVANLIHRMASPIDTLALLYPPPVGTQLSKGAELAGTRALSRYWQRCGLMPIELQPQFLGSATAYSYLSRARAELRPVADVAITVPRSLIGQEPLADPRHTVTGDPEPVGLRLVRN